MKLVPECIVLLEKGDSRTWWILEPHAYVAVSAGSWYDRFRLYRKPALSDHATRRHHNACPFNLSYECGVEGVSVAQIRNPLMSFMAANGFHQDGTYGAVGHGTRQYVFLAHSKKPNGPYTSMGPAIAPQELGFINGETGHPTVFVDESDPLYIYICFQARGHVYTGPETAKNSWNVWIARYLISDLLPTCQL